MKTEEEKVEARIFKSKEFENRIKAIEKRLDRLKETFEEIKEWMGKRSG